MPPYTTPTRRGLMALSFAAAASPALAGEDAASRLYRRAIVLDGNLIAGPLFGGPTVDKVTAARIRASGLTAMKETLGDTSDGFAVTAKKIAELKAAITRNAELFTQVTHVGEIAEAKRTGKIGVIFSFESASMHEGRLASIDHFAGDGVRVMGLSYNIGSPFGGGTLQPADCGLTSLGQEAVARMNALGVTVDLSHSNEATGSQAAAASRAPVLITHAGCAAVHPHPRNKSDALLRQVAESGGVTGIYDLSFLGNYPERPTLNVYMRHLTHALAVCGEDHVGIGSDQDIMPMDPSPAERVAGEAHEAERHRLGVAAPEELAFPFVTGLNGPERWQVISRELLRRGYRERTVEKVLGSNFVRVFADTWPVAAKLRSA
jgi:membrane dipeptidase